MIALKIILYPIITLCSFLLIKKDFSKYEKNPYKAKVVTLLTILIISLGIAFYSLPFGDFFQWSDIEYYESRFVNNLDVSGSIGLTYFFKFIHLITPNFNVVLFVIAFLTTFITLIAYRLTKEPSPMCFVFLFFTTFFIQFVQTALKEAVACSLLFIAFVLFRKKKYLLTFILFAISLMFHITSVIFLFILLFYIIGNSKNDVLKVSIMLVCLLALVLYRPIFELLLIIFRNVPAIYGKLFEYSQSNLTSDSSTGVIVIKGLPFYLIILMGFVYKNRLSKYISNYEGLLFVCIFGAVLYLFSFYSYWMSRFIAYFLFAFGLFAGRIFYINKKINRKKIDLFELIILLSAATFTMRELVIYYVR